MQGEGADGKSHAPVSLKWTLCSTEKGGTFGTFDGRVMPTHDCTVRRQETRLIPGG